MLYLAYQAHSDFMVPVRTLAGLAIKAMTPVEPVGAVAFTRNLTAAYELIARAGLSHDRPPFGIDSVMVGNEEVAVHEEATRVTPFGTLLHFKKNIDTAQPRVLLVAPLSGHFATLLRATVKTLLSDHDVFITDWHNVRDVPRSKGRFGFDEYIQHVVEFLETIGPGAHVVAVCQPSARTDGVPGVVLPITTWQNWSARRWSVGSSDRVATQSILPECGLCVPTSFYARKSSSLYWPASSVPVAGRPKSAPPWIIITSRCAKNSIEPLKPSAWQSPEQQTGGLRQPTTCCRSCFD
jgi:hypothetical protein